MVTAHPLQQPLPQCNEPSGDSTGSHVNSLMHGTTLQIKSDLV